MKTFKKYFVVPAPPEDVYRALTNANTIHLWSGEKAVMSTEPDTEFSLWDGSIVGKNIAFEPDKMIVQEWYFGDQPDRSVVTLKLHPHKKGTSVEVHHTNIPDADYDDIVLGWEDNYIGSLIEFYTE